MPDNSFIHRCIFDILDGLRDGLSHFSQNSRAALIYAIQPKDLIRVCDPQDLLLGHEPRLKEIYLDSNQWRKKAPKQQSMIQFGHIYQEEDLNLTGLISFGGRSDSLFYQMWFTEHHPDMCSTGPTQRWLEHAAWRLSHDIANEDALYTGISGYFLREYSTHAVRDFILDEMNVQLGWDSPIRVYPILEAVLGISKTREEGSWPRGELVFVEPAMLPKIDFIAIFPQSEQPGLENFKHVRKLLQSVEDSERKLVSDGKTIVGITRGDLAVFHIAANFRGGHGFLKINDEPVCNFSNGSFHSSSRRAKLVEVEEALIESEMDNDSRTSLFKIISKLVHYAEEQKHGCTLIIDLNDPSVEVSGQKLQKPLDLTQEYLIELAAALSKVDGALHICADLKLHGFACLLDGHAIAGEDRARGARFNSALRFAAEHSNLLVVVVSSDRPVSIIQDGLVLDAQCRLEPVSGFTGKPPLMKAWIN